MIQTVFSANLPAGEQLLVKKNRITGGARKGPRKGPRIAVVTGTHGDELEGQFVAFELARRLTNRIVNLHGTVDIYPAINPLGLSSHERGVPQFDIDLDRTFPGNQNGSLTDALAAAVLADIQGARVCIDVHSSSIYVKEVTQIRVDKERADALTPLALMLNANLVWVRETSAAEKSSLAHALNERGVPSLVVDMGSGMHLNEDAGSWLVEGILRLLSEHMHAYTGPTIALPLPRITDGSDVVAITSDRSGLFLPRVRHGEHVEKGALVGIVVDPLAGVTKQEIFAPGAGVLFTLRTYPLVYPGSLLARLLEGKS